MANLDATAGSVIELSRVPIGSKQLVTYRLTVTGGDDYFFTHSKQVVAVVGSVTLETTAEADCPFFQKNAKDTVAGSEVEGDSPGYLALDVATAGTEEVTVLVEV